MSFLYQIVVVCIVSIAFVYPSHAKYPKYGSYEHHRIFSTCSTGNTGWKNTFIRSALQSWLRSVVPLRHLKGDVNHADKTLFQTTVGQFYVNETNYQLVAVENNDMVWFQFGGEDEADGWLVGRMSVSNHVATGEDLGFIFPDFSTALVGKFERDKLISGHARKVKAYRCQNGIMELMYDILFQPDSVYKFEEANGTFITSEPLLMDPYDKRNVYVMPSRIPNTGQGLFAKRTIPARTLVVSYAGIKVVDEELLFHDKMTSAEEEDAHKNLMSYSDDFSLDIPPHLSSLHQYRATLAHKCQHAFNVDNAEFCFFKHPRFGYIRGLMSKRTIQRHEEIHVDYGYNLKEHSTPKWFRELHLHTFGQAGPQDLEIPRLFNVTIH